MKQLDNFNSHCINVKTYDFVLCPGKISYPSGIW